MRVFRVTLAVLLALAIVGVPARYASARYFTYRNFRVVEEDKIYRSGQLKPEAMARVFHDHKIATVVSFRSPDTNDSDSWEEAFCYHHGVRHFRVKPDHWISDDGRPVPAQKSIDEFLAIVKNPANYPILIHCLRGVHRTGAYTAIYRMECQGWSNEEAMAEMKAMGYKTLDKEEDISGFMTNYTPTWKAQAK